MLNHSLWIVGPSRSGKTERLVQQFCSWVDHSNQNQERFYTYNPQQKNIPSIPKSLYPQHNELGVLVFAANGDNRRELADKIVTATWGKYPVKAKTPLGFFQDEVILFWPLLIESLQIKALFPVRLRPETEQELATKLWHSRLNEETLRSVGLGESRLVRRILDLLQLAALSGTPCEDIPQVLTRVISQQDNFTNLEPEFIGSLLLDWRNWCLDRGFLTYGIITELYSQHLLSDENYLSRLRKRYQAVLADDVQDYPGLMRQLFELILDGGVGAFSYNPDGIVRLGLGADPNYMEGLAQYCQIETVTQPPILSLSDMLSSSMTQLVTEPMTLLSLPASVQSIQTISRATLLQKTAEKIIETVKSGIVQPREIAIIAPGLDAIARYSFIEMLRKAEITVDSLQDKRPLIGSPLVRALLTLITLVYPGLGRLVDRDAVAEMLVVISSKSDKNYFIDPVRAGLIADYCFEPHPHNPNLLNVDTFERWDRLGYSATTAYGKILQWLERQRLRYQQRQIPNPVFFLYDAIEDFMSDVSDSSYEQLAILRQLLETAQHYWEIDTRLNQYNYSQNYYSQTNFDSLQAPIEKESKQNQTKTILEFIILLRQGTVTASPYPIRPIGSLANAVTLATIFQYRSLRHSHRWHFWLDAGSPLWTKGGAATLFGSMFFLQDRFAQPWSAEDEKVAEDERLQRIIEDLLARVSDKIYLCHSELAVNGQEQLGSLLPLVNACVTANSEQ
ncbi:MAG: recombinase family protein [Rivularia sp. (in: Bacteria)]|nr:recombinase family protein [Rivularia sp. MS3]